MFKKKVSRLYLWIPHLKIQPTTDGKYSGKNISRKFQKTELEFAVHGNYLHSIYNVLGIISNLEMS